MFRADSTPARRRWRVVVSLIVLVAALMLLRTGHDGKRAPVSGDAERAGRVLAAAAAAHVTPAAAPLTPTLAATPPAVAAAPARDTMAHATADDYRRRARYPHYSVPIDGQDPILRDRQVSANAFAGPGGAEPLLVAFPDQVSFEHPDPIVLFAYLSVQGAPVPARAMGGELVDEHGTILRRFVLLDDGGDPDAGAGDFVYAARLDPSTTPSLQLKGLYTVRVHAATSAGEDRFASTGFLYSVPDAQLTGRYADRAADGNLEIRAEVDVFAEGRFHLEATLYSQAGQPLVWAQNALTLSRGRDWIPLTFYGLALRDAHTDGPYVLRFVALSTTTDMPNQKNRLMENAYVTKAYAVSEFSDQPFNDPNLLETAGRIEEQLQPHAPPAVAPPGP